MQGRMQIPCSCSPHPITVSVGAPLPFGYPVQWRPLALARQVAVQIPVGRVAMRLSCFGSAGDKRRGRPRQHTTGVSFGARGDKVVASYHGDHAYSFDITRSPTEAAQSTVSYASQPAPRSSSSAAPNSQPEACSTSGREAFTHAAFRTPNSE